MKPVTCYQTDDSGIFLHTVTAYPFPMEDRLNVPYQAVQTAVPEIPTGHRARWLSPFRPMDPEYDTAGAGRADRRIPGASLNRTH